jgi:murein DD-endopeptidase MepM/ murein hydrolase activator NlpD
MSVHRREFLRTMLAALPAVCVGRAQTLATGAPPPVVINHNADGRAEITEGRTLLVTLTFPTTVSRLAGSFPVEIETAAGLRFVEEQPLFFYPAGDGRTFRTILSAPLDAVAGDYPLRLTDGGGAGIVVGREIITYRVTEGTYRRSALKLSNNFSEPPPQIRERIRREFETMVGVYKARTPRRWRAGFVRPVSDADANNFGVRRVVNGSKRYRHAGLDYRAPPGTPVRAVNDGVVVLSTTHWTPGQLVCVDHGGGIFSRYIHLSERRVRRGETVRRGQVIALSGKSGGQRTRPHLHVDVVVNGTQVSPKGLRQTAARLLAAEAS